MAPKNRGRIYSNASKKKKKRQTFRDKMRKARNYSYIKTTKISSIRIPGLLSSNPCLSTSPGLAILLGKADRLSLSIMAEGADISVERTRTQLLLRSRGDCEKFLEKLRRSFFSLGAVLHLISHLSQLLHKLSNTLAVLEWAALFESRAVTSQAFALGDKDGVWTHIFAKCWTREHGVV